MMILELIPVMEIQWLQEYMSLLLQKVDAKQQMFDKMDLLSFLSVRSQQNGLISVVIFDALFLFAAPFLFVLQLFDQKLLQNVGKIYLGIDQPFC